MLERSRSIDSNIYLEGQTVVAAEGIIYADRLGLDIDDAEGPVVRIIDGYKQEILGKDIDAFCPPAHLGVTRIAQGRTKERRVAVYRRQTVGVGICSIGNELHIKVDDFIVQPGVRRKFIDVLVFHNRCLVHRDLALLIARHVFAYLAFPRQTSQPVGYLLLLLEHTTSSSSFVNSRTADGFSMIVSASRSSYDSSVSV